MTDQPMLTLLDGHSIPQLGYGVWQIDDDKAPDMVKAALDAGFRHIDTAQAYGNEAGVGKGISESSVPREEIFLTSKLRTSHQPYDKAISSVEDSLERMGLDYADLFLIHWPVPEHDTYADNFKAFVDLRERGLVKSIGVSNFLPQHIDRIEAETGVLPAVNQLELHPYYQQRDVRAYHAVKGIAIECYSPLGRGDVLEDEVLSDIAKSYDKSVAQVIIRWHLQEGLIPLPKTSTPERMKENFKALDFELSDEDMERIIALDKPDGKILPGPLENNNLF